MEIDKAIEIQEQYLKQPETHLSDDLDGAIKLGIEALKRCKTLRSPSNFSPMRPLPGETS